MAKGKTTKTGEKPQHGPGMRTLAVIAVIAAIVAAMAAYAIGGAETGGHASFQQFLQRFYGAPNVAIYVDYTNATVLAYETTCVSSMIYQITSSKSHHRIPASIQFYELNATSCFAPAGPLGTSNGSITRSEPLANCTRKIGTVPTILMNYSEVNATRITSSYLYLSGNLAFIKACGIASEIG